MSPVFLGSGHDTYAYAQGRVNEIQRNPFDIRGVWMRLSAGDREMGRRSVLQRTRFNSVLTFLIVIVIIILLSLRKDTED